MRRPLSPSRKLRTLLPENLSSPDFADLSGLESVDGLTYASSPTEGKYIRFPAGSKGFFYWYSEKGAPDLAGQIRFCITGSSDPAQVHKGKDLQLPDEETWNISLFELAHRNKYRALQELVLSEGLASARSLQSALRATHFPVPLDGKNVYVWIPRKSRIERVRMAMPYSDALRSSSSPVYTGKIILQFERSILPEHEGTRTVVLRIVEVLDFAKQDVTQGDPIVPEPKAGGLFLTRKTSPGLMHWVPWSFNVDDPAELTRKRVKSALEVFFENEASPPDRPR
ncbi:hypothetical protein OE88DRAFT_1733879 [Heliocybe sulcata]|uniref:Uncharacterized protein n=1 Tax=Heliocybe sulcata TaxID=5364 RepID=A0A5C3NH67_9AGAM|nr:hypothetical protein OE88DRAFT_1733879 [Heliocybe sulcata]